MGRQLVAAAACAVRRRSRRSCAPLRAGTETAPARRELLERLLERLTREVRPKLRSEHELGVRALPQQIVGQPELSAGADQQVRIVHLRGVQVTAKLLLARSFKGGRGVDDLRPAAVVEGDEEPDDVVV